MFVRLSLVFIPSPDVTHLVLLLVKVNSSPSRLSDNEAKQAFTELGQSWDFSEDLFRSIEKVTCSFYSSGANSSDVNDFRYNLFFAKNEEIEFYQLPPCKDCLRKHTMRANYQACIWRRRLQCSPLILDPVGFGWKMGSSAENEFSLTIDWMDGKPAPEAALELLACICPRSCRLSDCVCRGGCGSHCLWR